MRRRLFTQIYLSFLTVSFLTLLAAGVSVRWAIYRTLEVPRTVRTATQMVFQTLPDPSAAPREFRVALARRAEELGVHVSVWSASGKLLARVGDRLPTSSRLHPTMGTPVVRCSRDVCSCPKASGWPWQAWMPAP